MTAGESNVDEFLGALYASSSGRVFATLVRLLGDFDLAEEAMQEAFAAAVEVWRRQGVPDNPVAWLISTGRFKAVDRLRRRARLEGLETELLRRVEELEELNASARERELEDDRLRLIFTCCHPAIDRSVQVPLTLREVCGLSTEEIARAFLVSPSAMAQRLVRGKAKIRTARIPYVIPSGADLPERLQAVLSVVYLVFNEGYYASAGASVTRSDLSEEAIRLARLLADLLPEPEALGLLALTLLHESRRAARTSADGDIVLLEDQDRSRWNREFITEGVGLVRRALAQGPVGPYVLQAAIAAVHAQAPTAAATEWNQIVGLYTLLLRLEPSPVIALNRAVAVAMRDGPGAGVELIDEIMAGGDLQGYHLAHAARGELLRRLGDRVGARAAFEKALELAGQEPERRLLRQRLDTLDA